MNLSSCLRKNLPAFSLLEVALSIMIVGVALACVVPIFKTISVANSMRSNEEKFTRIRFAMQAYLLRHGHLPEAAQDTDGKSTPELTKGYVPYKTLGIERKYMFDVKSKPFSYVVNKFVIKAPGITFLPITMPLTTCIKPGQVTFCRYYKFNSPKSKFPDYYDWASSAPEEEKLCLFDNNENVLSHDEPIYIMKPLFKFMQMHTLIDWQKQSLQEKSIQYKSGDIVAWILISHGTPKNGQTSKAQYINIKSMRYFHMNFKDGAFNDIVFYQTRFDMAAQVGFPATVEPIYGIGVVYGSKYNLDAIANKTPETTAPIANPTPPSLQNSEKDKKTCQVPLIDIPSCNPDE